MLKWFLSVIALAVVAGVSFFVGLIAGPPEEFPSDRIKAVRTVFTGPPPPPRTPPPAIPRDQMVWPEITHEMEATCTPASRPISVAFGNNHDAVYLPGTSDSPYPHYLLIPGEVGTAQLYGAQTLSAEPDPWDLLVTDYHVAKVYELDDGIVIDDTYYIFAARRVFAYRGDIAQGSRQWETVGTFPEVVDDVGVYFDGDTVHLFGEYGDFEQSDADGNVVSRPDGGSIAHMTSGPDFDEWVMVDPEIANPNPDDTVIWGVGDASIIELNGQILMTTDIEAEGQPYRIALWRSPALGEKFDYAGIIAEPAPGTDGFYNYRVQDGDMVIAEDGSVIMFANWRDIDGDPGRTLAGALPDGTTRVIGGYTCRFD